MLIKGPSPLFNRATEVFVLATVSRLEQPTLGKKFKQQARK